MTTLNLIMTVISCFLLGVLVGMVIMYIRLNWNKFKEDV